MAAARRPEGSRDMEKLLASGSAMAVLSSVAGSELNLLMLNEGACFRETPSGLKAETPQSGRARPVDVARGLGITKAAVTRQMKRLERHGLLARGGARKNRRLAVDWERVYALFLERGCGQLLGLDAEGLAQDSRQAKRLDSLRKVAETHFHAMLKRPKMKRFMLTYLMYKVAFRLEGGGMDRAFADLAAYVSRLGAALYPIYQEGTLRLLEADEREFIGDLTLMGLFASPGLHAADTRAASLIEEAIRAKDPSFRSLDGRIREELAKLYIREFLAKPGAERSKGCIFTSPDAIRAMAEGRGLGLFIGAGLSADEKKKFLRK